MMSNWFFVWSLVLIGLTLLLGVLMVPIVLVFIYFHFAKRFDDVRERVYSFMSLQKK